MAAPLDFGQRPTVGVNGTGQAILRARVLLLVLAVPLEAFAAKAPLELQPGTARPGDAVLIRVHGTKESPGGKLGEDPIEFLSGKWGHDALKGLSVDHAAQTLPVHVELKGQDPLDGEIEVTEPNFPTRELTVAKKFISPPAKVKKQIAEDKHAFAKAFAQKSVPWLFKKNFAWPRRSRTTAPFGDLRTFNGKKQSQHFGMDLDGRIGDPILAANDGVVVMVRPAYASGNTVLVHHGGSLYTAYFHMSKFEVAEGAHVLRGQKLGEVGKTGRVTGPHLHFGVKVDGRWVNPASVLRLNFEEG